MLTADAKWFLLDDRAGAGIEGSGVVRMFRGAGLAAYWYQRSLPLAGKQEGNPCYRNPALARGANIWRGRIVHPAVAHALGERATPLEALLDEKR